MSVPVPSPSAIHSPSPTAAKTIPRARPAPINLDSPAESHSPSSFGQSPGRPQHGHGSGARRPSRSAGAGVGIGQSPGNDANWRERVGSGGERGVVAAKSKGPERTVGGFGKKDPAPLNGLTIIGGDLDSKKVAGSDKVAALAHVPCRFYKAGSCTAGDSCPFSHEGGGKKEVCQWFLKGNCKFGHKCALAHLRPGEPISMDRKNKKAAQLEAKGEKAPSSSAEATEIASPASIPVRSALSASLQTSAIPVPPIPTPTNGEAGSSTRMSSSPMREPYGPPSGSNPGVGSSSAGFLGRSPGAFGASPNRPSPLSASFSARLVVPGSIALKGAPTTAVQPSRVPVTAGPGAGFASSFSHSTLTPDPPRPPLSASLADGSYLRRSIWAHSQTPDEPLSPRRPILPSSSQSRDDVFDDDDDNDHGEDLLPSSLSELLTPIERARRMSRRDSNDYFGASPSRPYLSSSNSGGQYWGGERLAQSAGAAMGPAALPHANWSAGRSGAPGETGHSDGDFRFGPSTAAAAPAPRQSLLSSSRSPISPLRHQAQVRTRPFGEHSYSRAVVGSGPDGELDLASLAPPYFTRGTDPSSPSARALSEHAPGQSLPGGVATALSRIHLLGGVPSGTNRGDNARNAAVVDDRGDLAGREEGEEEMFTMDG